MKVILLAGVPLKKLAKEMNWPQIPTGGWIDGLTESLMKYYGSECELVYVFTHCLSGKEVRGKINVGGGNKLYRNTN